MQVSGRPCGDRSKRVWPHVFRHSYCTYLLQQNVSPAKVMQLLGHSSMEMVMQVYNQLRRSGASVRRCKDC